MLNVGLIGLGGITKYYEPALQANSHLRLVAVCDSDEQKLTRHAQSSVATFADYRELLQIEGLDAVFVNVPNDLHFAICRESLLNGKHVCCEKPLATRTDHAANLVELSKAVDRVLLTAFHRRHNAHVQRAKRQFVDQTEITAIEVNYFEKIEEHCTGEAWYLDSERCGGGCVADNGPNAFDTISMFFDRLQVLDVVLGRDGHGVDRTAQIELRSNTGTPARINLDWNYPDGERKDLLIYTRQGNRFEFDLLAGFPGFKSSLWHEYIAIVAEFVQQIGLGNCHGEAGLAAAQFVEAVYALEGTNTLNA